MKNLLLLALALFGVRPAMASDNLVIIVVDQLSYWATDPAQRAPLELPNLDALAAQGMTFTHAYATSPVCAENRLALLTGQYPFTLGTDKLQPGVGTMGTILKAAGWDTGYIGKWHLSPTASANQYVVPADRIGWRWFAGKEGQPHYYVTGSSFRQNTGVPISTAPWEPTWNTQEALRFIRADRNRPFALVVNYGPPHPTKDHALMPPLTYTASQISLRPNVDPADALLAKAKYARYMTDCELMDVELGVLLAEIDLATTFVVLTADHGDMLYSHGLAGNQQKRRPWEECAHVPLIIAGPGLGAGVSDGGQMSTVDILPSMLSQLGVAVPASVQGGVFPYLSPTYFGHGEAAKSWEGQEWRGVVLGDVKYAVTKDGQTEVLFDLFADPFELTNQATNPVYQPTLLSMRAEAAARAAAIGDPFFGVSDED